MQEGNIAEFVKRNGEMYRRLVEQVPVVTYVQQFGEPNRTIYVSPQIEALLGYRPEDLIGDSKRWVNIVHPEDRERVLTEVIRASEAGEPLKIEYRALTKNDRFVWVRDEATVAQDEEGYSRFWHGVITDATVRKQAEEVLRIEASRLATLVENLQAGILVEDESRYIRHVNQQFCTMFGIPAPPQAIISVDCAQSAEEAKHLFADPDGFVRRIGEMLSERQAVAGEELSLADGRTFERDYAPIFVDENHRGHLWQYRDITERKQAETKLLETEAEYRTLVEQIPAIAYINALDKHNAGLYVSPQIESILGVSVAEWRSDPQYWVKLLHPDDRERVVAEVDRSYSRGERLVTEYRMCARDGRVVWFHDEAALVRDDTKQLRFHHGVMLDITERKRAEEALRESEARYRTLVEQIPAITYIEALDEEKLDHNLLYVSPQIEALLGYSPEEWRADPELWIRLLHPDDRERVLAEDARAEEIGEPFSAEYRTFARDGRVVWIRDEAVLLADAAGRPVYWQGVMHEITDQKRIEEALRRSEASLAEAQRIARLGNWEWDVKNDEMRWSDETYRIHGYEPGEFVMTLDGLIEAVHPEDRELVKEIVRCALYEHKLCDVEHRIVRPDGTERVVHRRAEAVFDEQDEPLRIAGTLQDITERKRAEEELRESERRYRRQATELSLLDIVRTALARELELSEVFHAVVEAIASTYGYALVSAYLLEDEELVLQHQVGYEHVIERVSKKEGVMGRVARTGEAVLLKDVSRDPAFLAAVEDIVSEVCVPLRNEGRVVGTLNVESTEGVELTEDDLRLVNAVGEHVNIAINRARLYSKMRESEERYRTLVQYGTDILTILEVDGTIRYESPAVERVLGYRPEDMVGTNGFSYLHPDDFERVLELFVEGIETNLPTATEEVRFRAADGSWVYLEMTGVNLLDDPDVEGIMVTSHDITERKYAEEALQRSEAGLAQAQRMAHLGNWAWNVKTGEVYWSNETFRIFGYEPQEFVPNPKTFVELVHPDDKDLVRENIEAALYRGRPYDFEHRIVRPDGEVRVIYCQAEVIFDDENQPWRMVGPVHDITERKQAEEALKQQREFLREVINTNPNLIFVKDWYGRFTLANKAVADIYGTTVEGLLGKSDADFNDNEQEVEDFLRADREVMEVLEEKFIPEEPVTNSRTGEVSWFQTIKVPLVSPHDQPRSILGVSTDITKRKQAEEELRESEEKYRSVVENVKEIIFQTDANGLWTFLNPAWAEITGFTVEESIGKNLLDYVHPEDRQRNTEEFQPLIERRKDYCRHEIRYLTKDGDFRWIEVYARLTLDADDNVVGTSGTLNDITERRRAERAVQESEARLRTVVESLGEGLLITDPRSVALYINHRLTELTGYTEEEMLGRPAYELLLPPEQWPEMLRRDKDRMEGLSERYEVQLKRKDGSFFWAEINATSYRDASGEIVGTLGAITDITERRRTEHALAESEERFRQLFEQSVDAVFVHDEKGRFVDCNSQAGRLLGYSREELLDLTVWDLSESMLTEEERAQKEKNGGTLWRRVLAGEPGTFAFGHEEINRRKDGTTFPVEVRVGSVDYGGRRMILASIRDITERRMFEEQLTYQALHDPLTDLPNRVLFVDRLEQALVQTRRHEEVMVAVLFMDLDNFKNVNDSLGHEVGDELLKAVASRVQRCMRPGDTAARLGGDEFAVLLEDVKSVRDAVWIAERIIDGLQAPFNLRGQEIFVTTSIGISLSASGQEGASAMLRDADLAMYKAKDKGKASYQVFDPLMYQQILERLELERGLRHAVEHDEFVIHYQPKVSLATGKVLGIEALVRWEHPERGLVPPEAFVSVAEETGLIISIGRWALEETCRRAAGWQKTYPRDLFQIVSVNVSASQLQLPSLLEDVAAILEKTGLDPRSLTLEITESVVMSEASSNIAMLDEIRELSIKLAIDDFGTGYSSLAYLKRFPVSYLKIDRSFVDELREDPDDTAVVAGMIGLAHTLGMQVIAEGVETSEQLRILRELGCDIAQGHYFSKALTHDALSTFLETDPHW